MITIGHQKSGLIYNYARHVYYLCQVVPEIVAGGYRRHCNVCGFEGKFLAFGSPPRPDARCPSCGCLERHRLLAFWFEENRELLSHAQVLHFAPEERIKNYLTGIVESYRGADLMPGKADLVLNVEDIDLPSGSVDLIICSHVLEHVDDVKALSEMHRVLRTGGVALFMFPVVEGWKRTLEASDLAASIDSRADRILYFGQHDHVRFYGRDVRNRIEDAGFALSEYVAEEPRVAENGLLRGEILFVATKSE